MDKKFIVHDCLLPDHRKQLIEDCKPFLRRLSEKHPAYQSDAPLRKYTKFDSVHKTFDYIAQHCLQTELIPYEHSSWFIMTQGKEDQYLMHNHPVDYVGVYYMNSHPSFTNGTEFEEYGLVEVPENSMVLFPGHLMHTPPLFKCSEYFERYTMSLNWNFKRS